MPKGRTVYICQQCGYQSSRWMGRCPECNAWDSLVETPLESEERRGTTQVSLVGAAQPQSIAEVSTDGYERMVVPIGEFNRVLGGGIVPGSLILISGDPGIGKCVTGDTRVLDPESGAYLPITAWANRLRPVLATDEMSLQLAPASVSRFLDHGIRPVVEVQTRLGRTLRCTPNHPLLTADGWRSVGELAPGTRIATPRELPYFGQEPMPAAAIKLLAYIIADGSAQSAINVTNCLPEVARDMEEIAAFFDMDLVRYHKKGSRAYQYRFVNHRRARIQARQQLAAKLWTAQKQAGISWAEWARRARVQYSSLNSWRRARCVPGEAELQRLADAVGLTLTELAPEARERAAIKTPIARFMEEVGLRFASAADKCVPERVFRLPREGVALFLQVLFTCDGSLYVNQNGQPGLSYSTISRQLAEDVQHLLLRFGLVATLRVKRSRVSGRPYTAYELVLLGVPNMQRFLATIGIMGRQEACAQIETMEIPQMTSTHRDTIPTGQNFWTRIREACASTSLAELSRRANVKIKYRRFDRPLRRSTVVKLAEALPDLRLYALGYGDVYWDEIERITPVGEAPVYDLCVPGHANFCANDLIVHNSTLLTQVAAQIAERGDTVLYVSAEESAQQVKLRAQRLGHAPKTLYVLSETNLDRALQHIEKMKPALVIVDSIQSVYLEALSSAAGSVSQVREGAAVLMRLAKEQHIPTFLVGHVTKTGAIAGPRVLEHIVDAVLYLEGDRFHQYRLLRGVKNRFGSTFEVGVFEMGAEGLVEVDNPSAAFLAERSPSTPGSTVVVTMEGTRPILVEVQALTSTTSLALPRRTANGIETGRLLMLAAVLSKRVGLTLGNQDIYVNVVGGMHIQEPAADLGVAVAIASVFRNVPADPEMALMGEIGLSGELRSVAQLERRILEASKLGFKRTLYPRGARKPSVPEGFEALGVRSLGEALEIALQR